MKPGGVYSNRRTGCSCLRGAVPWVPLLCLAVLAAAIPVWYIHTEQVMASTMKVLTQLQLDQAALEAVSKWLGVAKLVSLVALLLGLGVVLVVFLSEALDNCRRFGSCGAGKRGVKSLTSLIGLHAVMGFCIWLLLLFLVVLFAVMATWWFTAFAGENSVGYFEGVAKRAEDAVSRGAASADGYLGQVQEQAKEQVRAVAPQEAQQAPWFGAAMQSLDSWVEAQREQLRPQQICPANCASFGPLATLANLTDPCFCALDSIGSTAQDLATLKDRLAPAFAAVGAMLLLVTWMLMHAPSQFVHAKRDLREYKRFQEAAELLPANNTYAGTIVDPIHGTTVLPSVAPVDVAGAMSMYKNNSSLGSSPREAAYAANGRRPSSARLLSPAGRSSSQGLVVDARGASDTVDHATAVAALREATGAPPVLSEGTYGEPTAPPLWSSRRSQGRYGYGSMA